MKKYQFFEETQDKTDQIPNINNNQNKSYSLTLNDISPSGINQMQSIEDIIFICGKAIYKIKSAASKKEGYSKNTMCAVQAHPFRQKHCI